MLTIKGDIAGIITEAVVTDSMKALTDKLSYLNSWGDDASYTVQVEGEILDSKRREVDLRFLNKDGKPLMVGGLVYHESDNTWGIHT